MAHNLYPMYECEGVTFTIRDVYAEYLRERIAGNALAEDFGQFLRWLDGYGIDESGQRFPLWY